MKKCLFHPEHPAKLMWDIAIFIQTIFLAYWIPFSLTFLQDEISNELTIVEVIITSCYLTDILITFNTSIDHNGSLLKSRLKIAKIYLKKSFLLDFFSSFPFDWVVSSPFSSVSSDSKFISIIRLIKFIRIFRLLRLIKSKKLFARIENYILNEFISVFYALLKIAVFSTIVAHWIACIFYYVSITQVDTNDTNWINSAISGKGEEMQINERYVTSLYWAFTTMITIGYGDIVPLNGDEMVVTISCMLCSCAYYVMIIGNLGSLLASHMSIEQKKSEIRTGINRVIKRYKMPRDLQNKVKGFVNNLINDMSNYKINDYEVLDLLNHPLRLEILSFLYKNVLKNCQVLTKYFKDNLEQFTKALVIENFSPNEMIFYEKEVQRKIYFICSGQVCILHSRTSLIYKRLGKDDLFGEIGFFVGHPRTATAMSTDFTLIQSLDLDDAKEFSNDPFYFDSVVEKLSTFCSHNTYTALYVICYLCSCIGHVARDCRSEKVPSGIESVISNYKARKTRISKRRRSSAANFKPKRRDLYPSKFSNKNIELITKIKRFEEDGSALKKLSTLSVIDQILEEDEEDNFSDREFIN